MEMQSTYFGANLLIDAVSIHARRRGGTGTGEAWASASEHFAKRGSRDARDRDPGLIVGEHVTENDGCDEPREE